MATGFLTPPSPRLQMSLNIREAIKNGDIQQLKDLLQSGLKFHSGHMIISLHMVVASARLDSSPQPPRNCALELCGDPQVFRDMLEMVIQHLPNILGCVACLRELLLQQAIVCGHDFATVYLLGLNIELNARDDTKHRGCRKPPPEGPMLLQQDILDLAITAKRTPVIRLLLWLGCPVKPDHKKEAKKLSDEDVKKRLAEPHPLLTLCKAAIRTQFGRHGLEELGKNLPRMPPFLARQVLMGDVRDLAKGKSMFCDGHVLALQARLSSRPYSSDE